MTDAEAIDYIQKYWRASNGSGELGRLTTEDLINAQDAMDDLVWDAQGDADVRRQFARETLFSSALMVEPAGQTQALVQALNATRKGLPTWSISGGDKRQHGPRWVMLKRIYDAGAGKALFVSRDVPLTEWLGSTQISGLAMHIAITSDPDPEIRILAVKILQDLAVPADWLRQFKELRTFETLAEQIPSRQWSSNPTDDLGIRKTLQALAEGAQGRIEADFAKTQLGPAGALVGPAGWPTFPTGDGKPTLTAPRPKIPIWKNPRVLAGAGLGLFGGIMAGWSQKTNKRQR